MNENGEIATEAAGALAHAPAPPSVVDEGVDVSNQDAPQRNAGIVAVRAPVSDKDAGKELAHDSATVLAGPFGNGEIRTLNGDIAGDEFANDAINYQILLGKVDKLLERLKLDA